MKNSKDAFEMSDSPTEIKWSSPSSALPADHVLSSGAVIFPGAFDQQGCPLIVFPVEAQNKLTTELTKEEVSDFIHYFLRLHNKKEERLVSIVVDLRKTSLAIVRFIAETVLLLELHKRTVHSLYVVQPKKKDVLKLLSKLLAPGHSKHSHAAPFKRIFLKEVFELSNYIDRSQLTASLGGYLIYCHKSWVSFIKEIDAFVQEFLSVVHRLPSCIATLQTISRQPVPTGFEELREFCLVKEARFQQLRRELGLDELLRHCEHVLEKLRYPETDPCYQAMAGTALFTHTVFDMLQNYNRITAAVEKVELLWQQAFSKAHVQLQVLSLQRDAQQITEQMNDLQKKKLEPYRIEISRDAMRAETLKMEFEASVYTHAMALIRRADDVIHTLLETWASVETQPREQWVEELDRVKESFRSAVELPHQTLRTMCDFHFYYNKVKNWYNSVICEDFFQDLLWNGSCEGLGKLSYRSDMGSGLPAWRHSVHDFLRKNPCPEVEELVQLAHLSNVIADSELQHNGKRLSHRCMTLRKILTSPGSVPLHDLQLALQWQYEYLRGNQRNSPCSDHAMPQVLEAAQSTVNDVCGLPRDSGFVSDSHKESPTVHGTTSKEPTRQSPIGVLPTCAISGSVSVPGKPPSLSSFDSGFDGAGSSHLEIGSGREKQEGLSRLLGSRESVRPKPLQPQINEENISSVSDTEDHGEKIEFGTIDQASRASIQIIPKITLDSFNFEIKVKRSATLPKNPWLSLPVEDLESSYTVTITPSPQSQRRDLQSPNPSELSQQTDFSNRSHDQPTQTEEEVSPQTSETKSNFLQIEDNFEESELSPIRNVLSSTITDTGERPNGTYDGAPTLLWDSYDLHDVRQESCERLLSSLSEMSLSDWDLKEQEGLREVEQILDRAAGILQEEENVLAQEEMLDVLLKTEDPKDHWPMWSSEGQLSVMSSRDLAESGVIAFEEDLASPTKFDKHIDISPQNFGDQDCDRLSFPHVDHEENLTRVEVNDPKISRTDLLKELKDIHALEEQIVEESLKIHALRRCEAEGSLSEKPSAQVTTPSSSQDRRKFQMELEREKREVERMERHLNKEMEKECKLKKRLSKGRKVVKCSVMERASKLKNLEDVTLWDELILSCKGQQKDLKDLESAQQKLSHVTLEECTSSTVTEKPTVANPDMTEDHAKTQLAQGSTVTCRSVVDVETAQCNSASENSIESCADVQLEDTGQCTVSISGVSSLSNMQISTIAQLDKQHVCMEGSENEGEGRHLESSESHCKSAPCYDAGHKIAAIREIDVGGPDAVTPQIVLKHTLDTSGEQASFDPGGTPLEVPIPQPRKKYALSGGDQKNPCSEAQKSTADNPEIDPNPSTSSVTLHAVPPKPKERTDLHSSKLQSSLMHPETLEHNNNNNNKPCSEEIQQILHDAERPEEQVVSPDSSYSAQDQTDPLPVTDSHADSLTSVSERTRHDVSELCRVQELSESNIPVIPHSSGPCTRSVCTSPVNQQHLDINSINMTDFKTPIVLDTGSGLMKAGFADEDLPTTIFPNIIGVPKYEEVMNGHFERETYIGHDAQHMRGVLALRYPMRNGIIHNWEEMEMIWHHTFQQLCVEPEDHPVMLTEAAMNPQENRQRMVEIMFESFSVPLTYVAMQAVLALYAAGRTTGVVFDSGDGVSHSVPVYEGYSLPHAVQRFNLAGMDVTLHLQKLLQEQGVSMRTSAELEIVRDMKEKYCCVALDYEAELSGGGAASSPVHYTMPDGQVISLSSERFRAPEILFKPELIGRDHYGVHESIFRSILQSDIDLQRTFVGNILLSGGNTLLAGLPERLQSEIKKMVPMDIAGCVRVTSPKDRDFSVWCGGAVLANLSAFSSAWISQEEYYEFGPQIVFRKCF